MLEPPANLVSALADRYTIESELGAGGMATVYLAEDVKHHRKVAVKVLRPELAAVLGAERFLNEIKVTAGLSHPNILQLFDSGRAAAVQGGRPQEFLFYVMPYIQGESLCDRMIREKQLPVEDALKIAEQVAVALEYAHRRDVVHRDIKPENILFHEGQAMVSDFGIALAVKSAGGDRLTETGMSLGTPAYMSPEQVAGDRELDGRSDIYSLACVLYEMLAGDPPFVASNPQAILAKHVTDPAPPITTVRSSVSQPVATAIAKALGKARADRFDSARAFSEGLLAEAAAVEPDVKSIVVLPFENLSPDPEQEYFSDGLTEEVISDLSKVHALEVISRSSAMTFKGSNKKLPEIAKELNVRYVLEGSVRRAGDNLRITAQLIDAEKDVHLWADKYKGTLEEVFEVQESVALAIVDALKLKLRPEEQRRIVERPIDNVAAYECYLRANQEVIGSSANSLGRAVQLLQNAIDILGPSAHLFAGMALVYWQYVNLGLMQEDGVALADDYLDKALALDPECPSANATRGFIQKDFLGRFEEGIISFKRALEINPGEPFALGGLAVTYMLIGQLDAAEAAVARLARVDPLAWMTHWCRAAAHFYAGSCDFGIELWKRLYEFEPDHPLGQFYYALGLTYGERSADALGILERATNTESAWAYSHMLKCALLGDKVGLDRELTAELRKTTSRDPYWSHQVAAMYALVGEQEETMGWIEQAVTRGFINYPMLAEHDPFLTKLRGRPEYEALLEGVKRDWESIEV